MLKGKPNTSVTITVIKKVNLNIKITLVREVIKFSAVKSKIIDNEVGYIRIATFNEKTYHQVVKAIQKMTNKSNNQLSGVMIKR